MTKKFTFLMAAIVLLLNLFVLPWKAVGQTTHTIGWGTASGEAGTYTNFENVSGTVTNVLSFNSQKNNSGSNPAYNSGSSELRLYYHSGGDGGSITITPAIGITITGAVMTTSTTPSVSYYVNGGSAVSVTASNNTYTISNISATTSLKIQNVNTSNTQLRIKTIAITYTVSSNPSISAENVNINAGTTSGSITYQINNGTSGAMVTAQVQSGGTIANLAIDNENITTTSVPFTCEANTANTAKTATVRLTYGNVTKDVTITQARYVPQVSGYTIDFEYETESYVDWTFSNIVSQLSGTGNPNMITAHGGSYYASTGGYGSASITTESVIANPGTLTCYITKTTTNTTSSTWKIQVKTAEANNWTDVKSQSATSMTQGAWVEFTADLSNYSNVYVRVYYDGSTAVRNIDDLSLTMASSDPSITAENVNIAYNAENGSIAYTIKNTPNPAGTLTATIAQSPASTIEGLTIGTINGSTVAFTCNANNTTTAHTATVTLTYTYGDNQTTTKDVVITQAAHPTPSITASDVNINGDATNGSIAYEINDGITGGSLSASTTSTWLTPGVVTNEAVPFTCEANQGAARSATVVLTYTYNTNQTVTKNVTVTQAKAPYTTIPAMFAGATSTNQTVDVTFNNWVVSGISSNGKYVFVTDNQGNGFVIYSSSDQSGTYAVGNILSGTASSCTLKLNNGYAQLTSVSGLTINNGGTVSVVNIALADLSGVHTGALVSYTNLECSVSNTTYTLTDGTTTIQLYTSIYNYTTTPGLVNGKTYNITGIYQQYNNTKEVLPRSTDDIVLKAQMTAPTFNAFTYVVGNTPTAQTAAIAGTDFSGNLTVTVEEGEYEVSNDGSNYGTTATFTKADGGSITSQTLYVKLNSNLSAGDYNGRLSFTADYLDSFDVNLTGSVTANPTYNVVLSQPAGDIATIAADPAYAQSGATITLSYSDVDDCYEFSSWSVMWEDTEMHEITPDANNQFTMPTAEVYVSAVFSQKKFTVDYSVNGSIREALQDVVDCGDEAYMWDEDEMEDEGVTMPTGYEFAGWSTSAGSSVIINSYTPTENAILYAVLLPAGNSMSYVKVTKLADITEGTYFIVNDGYVLPSATTSASTAPAKNNNYDIETPLSDTYNSLPVAGTEWIFTGSNTAMTIKNSEGMYLYAINDNNGVRVYTTSDTWAFETNGAGFAMKEANNNRYCATYTSDWRSYTSANHQNYGDGGVLYLYKQVAPQSYTYIEDITTINASLPSIEPTYLITVKNGGVLTLTGANNGDETNLIIEDGGQLVTTNSVKATFKKTTTASVEATEVSKGEAKNYWYAISSPVGNIAISSFVPAAPTDEKWNVYQYDEPTHYWQEYRVSQNPFTELVSGRGYLYRSTVEDIEFAGDVNVADAKYTLSYTEENGDNAGLNLIGNPFSYNIYKGREIPNTYLEGNFYTLTPEGGWELGYDNGTADPTEIKPNTGILVQAKSSGNDQDLDISKSSKGGVSRYGKDQISFRIENSEYSDIACVLFREGRGLNKVNHRNAEIPMLYITKEGESFASANMPDNTSVINIGFEAKTMGQYTFSLKTEGQYSYMHLYDKLTGEDVDMLLEDSYTFIGSPSDRKDRFVLNLNYNAAGIDTESDIFAYQSGNDIIVSGEGELQVFDVMGRMVATQTVNGVQTVSGLNNGVYIFRMGGKTQKIVIR